MVNFQNAAWNGLGLAWPAAWRPGKFNLYKLSKFNEKLLFKIS